MGLASTGMAGPSYFSVQIKTQNADGEHFSLAKALRIVNSCQSVLHAELTTASYRKGGRANPVKLMDRYANIMMLALVLTLGMAGCSSSKTTTDPGSPLAFSVVQAPQATCIVDVGGVATASECTPAGTLSSTTLTINPQPTVAGHGFVVVVSGEYSSNSAAGCTDNRSNTYTLIPGAHASVDLPNFNDSSGFSDMFYVASSSGSVTQVQCTLSSAFTNGTGDAEIWFVELNQPIGGVDRVAVLDNQSAMSTTTCPGPSITTTQPDEFILSGIWLSDTVTAVSAPFTLGSSARGNSIAYDSAVSTGMYQPTYTSSNENDGFAANVVSFTGGGAQ